MATPVFKTSAVLRSGLAKIAHQLVEEAHQHVADIRKEKRLKLSANEKAHQAKMSDAAVIEARKLFKFPIWTIPKLAEKYCVTETYMSALCHYRIRAHLDPLLPKYREW